MNFLNYFSPINFLIKNSLKIIEFCIFRIDKPKEYYREMMNKLNGFVVNHDQINIENLIPII